MAGEKSPVIVFRRGLVAEGSNLETALLTSAKRWKQKGNRAEKCYSWAVTYLSLSLIHTHKQRSPRQNSQNASGCCHRCRHASRHIQMHESILWGHIFSYSSLLWMQSALPLSFILWWLPLTSSPLMSPYLCIWKCSLIQGRGACHPQVHGVTIPGRQTHVKGHKVLSIQRERASEKHISTTVLVN